MGLTLRDVSFYNASLKSYLLIEQVSLKENEILHQQKTRLSTWEQSHLYDLLCCVVCEPPASCSVTDSPGNSFVRGLPSKQESRTVDSPDILECSTQVPWGGTGIFLEEHDFWKSLPVETMLQYQADDIVKRSQRDVGSPAWNRIMQICGERKRLHIMSKWQHSK